jgi:hypothetical protein
MTSMGTCTIPTQRIVNGVGRKAEFFSIIEDIWELDYGRDIKVALF